MVSHLISKYKDKFVSITFMAILIATVSLLSSCEDSLGYDPHVTIQEVGKDTTVIPPDDNEQPTVFDIDSISFKFIETVKYRHYYKTYTWRGKSLKKIFKIDTSGQNIKLWIDWKMVSTNKDTDYHHIRMDRVVKFEMIFAAILDTRTYKLDKTPEEQRWFKLYIKNMQKNRVYDFEYPRLDASIHFLEHNREAGMLNFLISAKPPVYAPVQTRKFEGLVYIYYKN